MLSRDYLIRVGGRRINDGNEFYPRDPDKENFCKLIRSRLKMARKVLKYQNKNLYFYCKSSDPPFEIPRKLLPKTSSHDLTLWSKTLWHRAYIRLSRRVHYI